MKLKKRVGDFRVRELLAPDAIRSEGPHRVYRVTKRKLTSIEAAAALAEHAEVQPGEVSLVGMKDRQGITIQYMSVHEGPHLSLREPNLLVEAVGFSDRPLEGSCGQGNAFEITARALDRTECGLLRRNLPRVREHGCVNYFGEQRFGNLRHNQGWVARLLIRGQTDSALRALIAAPSVHDDPVTAAFKHALARSWGQWEGCLKASRRFGRHRSVFQHLVTHPDDLAGAFRFVATRIRLIHLYAFQSHVWNRALADWIEATTGPRERAIVAAVEGPQVHPSGAFPSGPAEARTFRLPGPGLEDVADPEQRARLEAVLQRESIAPREFVIEGVSGFHLKGEDRNLRVRPANLRVRPVEPDPLTPGRGMVRLRFELPPGSYATVVVERLFADPRHPPRDGARDARREREGERGARRTHGPGSGRGAGGGRGPGGGGAARGAGGDRRERGGRGGKSGGRPGGGRTRNERSPVNGRGGDDRARRRG